MGRVGGGLYEQIFPPALTAEKIGEIIVFKQGEDESLYNRWDRFKRLLKRYPMHGIDLTTKMDIFYHDINYTSKGIIDASCCGAFKRISAEEARQVIEDISKCNYKAPFEASGSSSRLREVVMNNWETMKEECTPHMKWEH